MTDQLTRVEGLADGEPHRFADESTPMVSPSANTGLLEVFRRRYVLRLLVRREISGRYQGSFLGLLWSYINPLSQFAIYYFIMGTIFGLHAQIPNFAVHIFAAIIIVHFFNETLGAGTRSIVGNKALVTKMAVPREMFPVASMLVSLYHVLPQLVIIVVVCVLTGWTPDLAGVAALAIALVIITLLGTALALLFAAANVFFRDVGSVVGILTNLVRFGVPMIYSYTMVADRFGAIAPYYLLNPLAVAVLLFQKAFWIGTVPEGERAGQLPDDLLTQGLVMIGVSLVVLVIGQLVFSRLQNRVPERL